MQYFKNPLIIIALIAHAIFAIYMTANANTGGLVSRMIGGFIGTFAPSLLLAFIPTLIIAGLLFIIFGKKKKKKFINYFAILFLILSLFITYQMYSGYKYRICIETGQLSDCL